MSPKALATATSSGNTVGASPHADDLLLGFSFSIWPDGSPGRCNEQIAKNIKADLNRVRGAERPIVGLQWEVFDALADLNTVKVSAAQFVPDRLVAGPAVFDESDIGDASQLLTFLREGRFPAVRRLHACLTTELEGQSAPTAADLCAALNRLIGNRRLFDLFDGFVELADLDRSIARPELGLLGTEKRKLPMKGLYPVGLRKFQTLRINRLIVEAIVPAAVLKRAGDLDEERVLDHLLDAVNVPRVRSVLIYAHPVHRDRCRLKTLDALRERAWSGRDDRVSFGGALAWDSTRIWDADSAQVWCRSQENWDIYSQIP